MGDLNHASLREQLDAQLITWSLLSGALKKEDGPRWWTIDTFCPEEAASDERQFVDGMEGFLYNPIRPRRGKIPKIGGDIESGELNIAVIGDVRLKVTRNYWHCLGRMLRLSQTRLFPARSLQVVGLIYLPFVLDASIPSFDFSAKIWERPKDKHGRSLSPWALFKTDLLYFFRHLRQLPLRPSEYARLFLTCIEQVRNVLEKIRQVCAPAQVSSQLAEIDTFQKLEVFAIPQFLREFYRKAQAGTLAKAADDVLTPEKENQLYDELVNTIHSHPIPLALFVRASLLAMMLAFLGERILDKLSPSILNLEWLLAVPGLALDVLAFIPIAIAFWRYQVRTLNTLKKRIRSYVGAILRHAQTKAKERVKTEMAELFTQVQEYCDTIDKFLETLQEQLNYPQSSRRSYASTKFQHSLLDMSHVPEYEISVAGKRKRLSFDFTSLKSKQIDLLHYSIDPLFHHRFGLNLEKSVGEECCSPFSGIIGFGWL